MSGPGHFLSSHDDRHDKHDRVAAYVISMNKIWDKDWGGHLVQLGSPFAGKNRTSYSGWFHR
jgi:Rps23 Pro-64 3,4-dihydroxylase Tpa1-like proline 4-hydroxylase